MLNTLNTATLCTPHKINVRPLTADSAEALPQELTEGGRTRERQRQRLGPDPIVTFGESHNTELNGDSLQLALKTEEGEIPYLNEVSKAVDACYSTEAVEEHLERLDDLVPLRAHMMEQLAIGAFPAITVSRGRRKCLSVCH